MNRPPALDSKIETVMTSPTPTMMSGGGVRVLDPRLRRVNGSICEKNLTLSALRSTSVYFMFAAPFGVPTCCTADFSTASPSGPERGRDEQLASNVEDNATDTRARV